MFFAGFAGATAFFPQKVVDRAYVPPAVLTRFRLLDSTFEVDGERVSEIPVGLTSEIRLRPSQAKFSIEFAALSFLGPETNRFRYRLQGLQEEWTEVRSDQRVATYMSLPPGSYAFQVQGATGHGPWSPSAATLRIVMPPPWWRTWPSFALSTIVVAATLFLGYRVRVRQLTHAYNVRLEERLAERTRIARELHDTLLQSFQGLMFRLQAVRDLLPGQAIKSVPVLDLALLHGEEAIDEARNAVSGLRSSEKTEQPFDAGLAAFAAAAAQLSSGIEEAPRWQLVTKGSVKPIPGTVLYELYPLAQEAISNAFRHARAEHITIEVHYAIDALWIMVSDDGVGFDQALLAPERSRRHWGLQGMKERIEKLGGEMAVRSRPGGGTRVTLSVPAIVVYRDRLLAARVDRLGWWRKRSRTSNRG
jgi:signal transduction histidine kinase